MEAAIERPLLKIKNYVKPLTLPAMFRSTRHGVHKDILVVQIQKGKVYYKDKETDKHTNTLSEAKFNKLFKPL